MDAETKFTKKSAANKNKNTQFVQDIFGYVQLEGGKINDWFRENFS